MNKPKSINKNWKKYLLIDLGYKFYEWACQLEIRYGNDDN